MFKPRFVPLYLFIACILLTSGTIITRVAAEPHPPLVEGADTLTSGGLQPVAFLPFVIGSPELLSWVNTQDRDAVQQHYLIEYLASEGIDAEWTGNYSNCNPGSTSIAFHEAILRRINYFRAMAGVPAVTGFDDTYNSKAQAAALMMSINEALDHTPPTNWICYSDDGYSGASSSNLFLGVYGPAAISGYVADPGSGNYFVGHRRWILYPQTQYMGTGDIPPQNNHPPANALWVFDTENMWGPRPTTREPFVAWPPSGYVPYQIVYPRWSFAYPDADFNSATVTMSRNGQPIGTTVSPVMNGFGENTLVWELNNSISQPPNIDIVFDITIGNVIINGVGQQFNYQVILFDPNS